MNELNKFLSAKSNNKIVVMSIATGAYAFCLYVSILSLIKNSPKLSKFADILLLVKDIPDCDKKALKSLGYNVNVVDFDLPVSIENAPAVKRFTAATFFRYECFNLLDKYDKALLFDSDILVQKELLNIFDLLKSGIGMVPEKVNISNFSEKIYDIELPHPGFNAGVIAIDNRLTAGKEIAKFCYEMTDKYAEHLQHADQGVINWSCAKFKLDVTKLPNIYNMPASSSRDILNGAAIIHTTGHRKFWNYYYFDEWYKYYEQWIGAGGTPCFAARNDSPKYANFIKKHTLDKKVFFHLCPDFFKNPIKALRFTLKYLMKIKY